MSGFAPPKLNPVLGTLASLPPNTALVPPNAKPGGDKYKLQIY